MERTQAGGSSPTPPFRELRLSVLVGVGLVTAALSPSPPNGVPFWREYPARLMDNAVTDSGCEIRLMDNIGGRNICFVNIIRHLKLLDLRGNGAMRVGSVSAISSIADRQYTQAWSRYFYDNEQSFSRIDGIIYSSAHNEQPSIMLYQRAKDALFLAEDLPLNDPCLKAQIQGIAKDLMIAIRPEEWLNN